MARIRPSNAALIVQCNGALHMSELYPETEETVESKEGTAGHWVASELYESRKPALDSLTPNGCVVTREMVDGAELYVNTINAIVPPGRAVLEHFYSAPSIHPDNGGTPDGWYWDTVNNVIHVFDYKFGHGFVDVFENWQLINYAAAIRDLIKPQVGYDQVTFVFYIVQPRCFQVKESVRTWTVPYVEILSYWYVLYEAFAAATSETPTLKTGDGCKHCPARHACPTLQTAAYDITTWVGEFMTSHQNGEQLGRELTLFETSLTLLQARVDGLRQQAEILFRNGVNVVGWQLESSAGRERWTVSDNVVIELGKLGGLDLTKPALITPRQAVKMGLPDDIVSRYTTRETGVKLTKFKNLTGVFKNGN